MWAQKHTFSDLFRKEVGTWCWVTLSLRPIPPRIIMILWHGTLAVLPTALLSRVWLIRGPFPTKISQLLSLRGKWCWWMVFLENRLFQMSSWDLVELKMHPMLLISLVLYWNLYPCRYFDVIITAFQKDCSCFLQLFMFSNGRFLNGTNIFPDLYCLRKVLF